MEAQQQAIAELPQALESLRQQKQQQAERIEQLEAEVRSQKKLKGRPKVSPSRLNEAKGTSDPFLVRETARHSQETEETEL